eukprot:COSAG03_NODE_1119_length_4780_cov_155.441359_3_plen_79_part_00
MKGIDGYVYDGLYEVVEWKRVPSKAGPVVLQYKVRISDCAQSNLHTNLKSGPDGAALQRGGRGRQGRAVQHPVRLAST